jgi:glycosyltransferase involved in cell wall biosynthesis
MMHLFLNGLAASAGGGLTYLRNVLPHLSRYPSVQATVVAGQEVQREFAGLPNIFWQEVVIGGSPLWRAWQEQNQLPALVRRSRAGVLISAGNFALRESPVPQILLSRNALYTSRDFYRDLITRREYGLWLDTRAKAALAKKSIAWSACAVAPSVAFARELQAWTGREIRTIHHGFDHARFFADTTSLPSEVHEKLAASAGALRLLLVSHYNYYRNFETLFRALAFLRKELRDRPVKLFLTCTLQPGENPGAYRTERAAALVRELGITENIVELGAVPYRLLHHLYRACHVYVTPAYAETFAHPLVEAMACGVPVVASDLPVHQEICGDAAVYFPKFSAEELGRQIANLAGSAEVQRRMVTAGEARSREFSWEKHVEELLTLAAGMAS